MTLTPIAGATRLRALQIGKESSFKTQVAATRRLPWGFQPSVDPQWTLPNADTGTLDPAIAPYRMALIAGGQATTGSPGGIAFNDIVDVLAYGVMGGITPSSSSTSRTWVYAPASLTPDIFDTATLEFFDDAAADAWAGLGAVIDRFELTYPEDQGPIGLSAEFIIAKTVYPATPTAAIQVDAAPTYAFFADTEVYINDSAGTIETTKLSDIAYSAGLTYENNTDRKYFANGSNSRFEVQNYGRGERVITLTLNGAKQSAWIAEAVKWIAANPTERFIGLKTTSVVEAASGIPYAFDVRFPGYWMTREWTEINSNTGFSLTARQTYDQTLTYPVRFSVTNTRTSL